MAQNDKPMGIYLRLSRDKSDEGNYSISIENQEGIIRKYAEDYPNKGIVLSENKIHVYIDDGYTGMNYNRPRFKDMMNDCRSGKICGIIVKDLSRLGRKLYETLQLIQETFVLEKIRFISIQEGYDSADPYASSTSLLMNAVGMMNEMHCEVTSAKTKEALLNLARQGKFIASKAPFGYSINPENKHHLLIDPEAASIVTRIYNLACEGHGYKSISGILRREGVLNPTAYVNKKNPKHHEKSEYWSKDHDWHASSIQTILNNPAYLGHVCYGRRGKVSWRLDKVERKEEKDWIMVKDMHESIITQEKWDLAHDVLSRRTKSCSNKAKQIFAGLLKCSTCGYSLSYRKGDDAKPKDNGCYKCSTYSIKGKDYCTIHYISYNDLYEIVLNEIREKATLAVNDREWFMRELQKSANSQEASKAKGSKVRLAKIEKDLAKLERKINNLYDDRDDGTITKDRFKQQMAETEDSIASLKQEREVLTVEITKTEETTANIRDFLDLITPYENLQILDHGLLNRLIERIIVSDKSHLGGKNYSQDVTIQFRFLGLLGMEINGAVTN